MKRITLTLVLALAVIALGSIAQADVITFTTTGVFTSGAANLRFGSGTSFIAFNGSNCTGFCDSNASGIKYNSNADTTIAPPASGINLGSFQTIAIGSGATASGSFTLTIFQTSPTVNNGALFGTISGTFHVLNGLGSVAFSSSSVTIDNIIYTLNNGNGVIQLNHPGTSNSFGQASTIEAEVNAVPEPASLALFGSGLVMGGNFIRRKVMGV